MHNVWLNAIIYYRLNDHLSNFNYSGGVWSWGWFSVLFSFTAQSVHVPHCLKDSYYFKEGKHGSVP